MEKQQYADSMISAPFAEDLEVAAAKATAPLSSIVEEHLGEAKLEPALADELEQVEEGPFEIIR